MKAFLSCERIFRAEFNSDCVEFPCGNGAVGVAFGLRKAVSRAVFGFSEAERERCTRKHGKMRLRPFAERVFEKERAVDGHKIRLDVADGIGVRKPRVVAVRLNLNGCAVGEAALNAKPRTESRHNAVLELRSVRRTRKRGVHAERKFAAARETAAWT